MRFSLYMYFEKTLNCGCYLNIFLEPFNPIFFIGGVETRNVDQSREAIKVLKIWNVAIRLN